MTADYDETLEEPDEMGGYCENHACYYRLGRGCQSCREEWTQRLLKEHLEEREYGH